MNLSNNKQPNQGCGLGCAVLIVAILSIGYPQLLWIIAIIGIAYLIKDGKHILDLKKKVSQLEEEKENLNNELKTVELSNDEFKYIDLKKSLIELENKIESVKKESDNLSYKKLELEKEVMEVEDLVLMQSFGIYETKYDLEKSEQYKIKLDEIRKYQKEMVRQKIATNHSLDWTIEYDDRKGKEFILDTIKLSLKAFNNECDNIINKVKYNNLEISEKRINKIFKDINSLTDMQKVSIREEYLNLKIEELYLKYEYQCKLQEEKEKQQEEKERLREEAKVRKEIESLRKKVEKEEQHFINAITELQSKINNAYDEEKEQLLVKLLELEEKLASIDEAKKDIENRELNNKAGYVYIISNIGSFGEDVYKIGMTRRLDPMERIRELGGASVPFIFDVHAIIFTEDAPKLESKLHEKFRDKEVNKINHRKEFFKVNLEDIENVVKEEFNKTVDFIKTAEAEDFRKSLSLNYESEEVLS